MAYVTNDVEVTEGNTFTILATGASRVLLQNLQPDDPIQVQIGSAAPPDSDAGRVGFVMSKDMNLTALAIEDLEASDIVYGRKLPGKGHGDGLVTVIAKVAA